MSELCKGCRGFFLLTPTYARVCVGLAKCIASLAFYGKTQPITETYFQKSIASLALTETSAAGVIHADSRRPCPGCVGGNIRKGGVGDALTTGGQPALTDCVAALAESQGLLSLAASGQDVGVIDAIPCLRVSDAEKRAAQSSPYILLWNNRCREAIKNFIIK